MGLSHSDEYFGPEIQLGHILGEIYEEPVVIIKCAWDNKSLAKDFRPPSAGGTTGRYYKQILLSVKQTLNNVDDILLGQAAKDYSGAGHSLEGLIWWHGYSDVEDKDHRESYSDHLKLFMNDIRKDLKRPYLPIVIGELGGMGTKRVTLYEHNFRVYQERSVKDDAVQMSYFVKTHDKLDQKDIGFDKVGYEYYYHQAAFMITIGAAFAEGLLLLLNGDDDAMGNINVDPYTSTNAQADFQSYVTNNHNMILLVFGALMMGLVLVYAVSRNSVSLRTGWSRTMEKIRPAVRAVVPTDDEGNLLLGVMVVPTNAMAEAASDSLAYIDSTARSTYAYADETVRSLRDVQFVLKTSESRDDSGAHVNDTGSAIEAGMVAA
ncbi:hypothetical protein MPSEU_000848400 [Mayamaea pseudoterrestris]|nr:hypothetical protein MPSEU_000848400 [Mayamaea pseudoterrestris]